MTIASEITRLQTAKSDIKTAIEAKGVTVPSSAKIDTYDDYIGQIEQGSWETGAIFAPGSYTCGSIITSYGVGGKWYVWDGFNEDGTKYLNISTIEEYRSDSNKSWISMKTFIKTAGNDPVWGNPSFEYYDENTGGTNWASTLAGSRVAYDNDGGVTCTILIKKGKGSGDGYRNYWYLRGDVNEDLGVLSDSSMGDAGTEEALALLDSYTGITASQSLQPLGLTSYPIGENTGTSSSREWIFRYTLNWSNV